jgi:membrane protein DedA with SNARE-associated domain
MDAAIDGVIAFIGEHRAWAFWIALVFAFAENLAFLSIAIPSTAILVGVGALVATGEISFLPLFIGAAIGAMLGATVSWFLGLIYGDYILRLWPLRDYPVLVQRGKATLEKWGPLAVIGGHFFGPLRPVAPLLCGMSLMPFWKFQIYNVAGAIGWAWLVPKFGELGGILIGWLWTAFLGA